MTDLRVATLNLLNFAAPPLACYEWDNIYTEAQWLQKTSWLQSLLQQQQSAMQKMLPREKNSVSQVQRTHRVPR